MSNAVKTMDVLEDFGFVGGEVGCERTVGGASAALEATRRASGARTTLDCHGIDENFKDERIVNLKSSLR